jgi:hypothetical protein
MKAPRRGKFLGGEREGTEALSKHKPASAVTASSTPLKRIRPVPTVERQERLFADLDEAESLALELLDLASSTALSLAKAIVASSMEDSEDTFLKCEDLGDKYADKVKRIHALLSPHARLVVNYKNHAVDATKAVAAQDLQQTSSVPVNQPPSDLTANVEKQAESTDNMEKSNKTESSSLPSRDAKVEELINSPKNMYAARVELRLAIERQNVLCEMVRLEKEKQKKTKT